jgi:hypothetical protein
MRNAPGGVLDSTPGSSAIAAALGLGGAAKVDLGSPGMKNPAVERYDPTGSRSAMTANWGAVAGGLRHGRPTQLPRVGVRRAGGKLLKWGVTQSAPGEC